jgi:hypothetical protein
MITGDNKPGSLAKLAHKLARQSQHRIRLLRHATGCQKGLDDLARLRCQKAMKLLNS